MNPLKLFRLWYFALDQCDREHVAFLMVAVMPTETAQSPVLCGTCRVKFEEWLEQEGPLPHQIAGKAIAMRELVNFFIFQDASTEEAWKAKEGFWENIEESAKPKLIEQATKALRQLPETKRQWIALSAQWYKLCTNGLSNNAIHTWLESESACRSSGAT